MSLLTRIAQSLGLDACPSAKIVVPWLMDTFHPETIADVGCGYGAWAVEFWTKGCVVHGFDRDWQGTSIKALKSERAIFHPCNLRRGILPDTLRVDLALCLEVAEHLPANREQHLVSALCLLSDTVIFSAAVPGQGGFGHRNEQWQSHWIRLFERHGYNASDDLRNTFWDDERVEPWYRQNMLLFEKGLGQSTFIADVIHPDMWRRIGLMSLIKRLVSTSK